MLALLLRFVSPAALIGVGMGFSLLAGGGVSTLLQTKIVNPWFHDPQVRARALDGYVAQVELDAANAKAAEIQRQKIAGDAAVADLTQKLQATDAQAEEANQKLEQEIADRGKAVVLQGSQPRDCSLTDSDVEWLSKR